MVNIILTAQKVTKRFGGLAALSELDLEVQEHSIHSVIGPNGAGKTTFFNCVTGFHHLEEGDILFRQHSLARLSPERIVRLGIARTYQNIRLFANLPALDNILVAQHVHLRSGLLGAVLHLPGTLREEKKAVEEACRWLQFVDLADKGNLLARNLPYGDQRRLEIARALATQPQLLLLDEPTAGMNPAETQAMMDFIVCLRDELGITILLIEHQMRVVMNISDQVTVLNYGCKISEGKPAEIQSDPTVIEAYLGHGSGSEPSVA